MKKLAIVFPAALLCGFLAILITSSPSAVADPPYPERAMGTWVRSRLSYEVPAAAARIESVAAIAAARGFGRAPAASVNSFRLASYNDPFIGPRLVWVVDLSGLDIRDIGGGGSSAYAPPVIDRAVFFVSATEPNLVIAQYSLSPSR